MSWEKSRFSNVMWFLYVLMTGWALFRMARMIANAIPEESQYGGVLLALEIALVTGSVVFLIYRFRTRHLEAGRDDLSFSLVGQGIVVALILGAGLVFRITRMSEAGELASYFEMAKVTEGQQVPQLVHGASHIYVQLLHIVLVFIGNKFSAGVWLQIILQCVAALLLYFAVRKLVGALAATISLAYTMFSGYMIQESLNLSPRMLYLLLFALGLFMISLGIKGELQPLWFLVKGLLIGILGFFDSGGFLLLFFLAAIILAEREQDNEISKQFISAGLGLAGTIAGFGSMILADALLSGISASQIYAVWRRVYWSEYFQVPVHQGWDGFGLASILLLVTLAIGIFSYWYDRESERISVWVFTFFGALLAGVCGVFTDVIPVDMYLYIIMIVLAGIGVDECFRKTSVTAPMAIVSKGAEEKVMNTQAAVPTTRSTASKPNSDEIWEPAPRFKPKEVSMPVQPAGTVSDESIAQKPAEQAENIAVKPVEKTDSISGTMTLKQPSESAGWKPIIGNAEPAEDTSEDEEIWGGTLNQTAKESDEPVPEKKTETKLLENPLPLPKPHQKRTLGFDKVSSAGDDDFDHPVSPNDDFDIK